MPVFWYGDVQKLLSALLPTMASEDLHTHAHPMGYQSHAGGDKKIPRLSILQPIPQGGVEILWP